jgi:hypothetical protein
VGSLDPDSLCAAAFSAPVQSGPAAAPIFTEISQEYLSPGWSPGGMRLPFLASQTASEANTLACILETRIFVGSYSDGQPGYRLAWDIRLVQVSTGQALAE